MTQRFVKRDLWAALKIVWGFVFKAAVSNAPLFRELFFDAALSDHILSRYMERFREDSRVGLELAALAPALPSFTSRRPLGRLGGGVAIWIPVPTEEQEQEKGQGQEQEKGQEQDQGQLRRLVLGAELDYGTPAAGTKKARVLYS
ncbi:hypothetical protein B484DRAFT_455784 [Ochromonadaceae sp. CCMP2298]|nr:hypothetical protein B484DRAFT_455784 [Ochromonadaceae sp. CCMP2298]|mmetsp:Transcript_9083/g.20024  ORF Transcript_9083/g.20024 Transcript_9083/m.20024 type:complete len:145 (-) Transcript_9083:118-552(-)|eukprot:CAMPEP_0173176754 /NCGR_PEP_ID=MMETSP1141-20130122/4634_1 /TAXON_ID=483371 /ORGANISM="non described non described, Strain CCMP2298" /LENGTH=144 /DNA_ID=CAMNT_0014099125 /DNA_START=263 /DNA_END=697 /DNA_ORIENTATION=+